MPKYGYLGAGGTGDSTVVSGEIVSGTIVDYARALINGDFSAAEVLSGPGVAVAFTTSGTLQLAMAGNPNRMPAVGVIASNYLSGAQVIAFRNGLQYAPTFNFSGWPNETVFVGESGTLLASGTPLSGSVQQIVGTTVNASGLFLQIGDPLTQVTVLSGDLGSGQVGTVHAASGYPAAWNSDFLAAGELISGLKAVCLLSNGALGLAMAGSGLRLPAIGVVASNYVSGASAQYFWGGNVGANSGLAAGWSGMQGKHLYAGSGGQVVIQSGLLSGASWQRLGVATSGGLQLSIQLDISSGAETSPAGAF